jgi:hypothetical protein
MSISSQRRKFALPVGLVLLAAFAGGCSGTTYGTGVTAGRQTVSDLTGIVTLGKKDKQDIEYQPRAGIVAPPNTSALPKPGETTAADNWPVDPSSTKNTSKKRSLALAEDRAGGITDEEILSDPGIRLPSNQKERVYNNDDPDSAENQMRNMQSVKKDQEAVFAKAKSSRIGAVDENGNPVRTTLTEPPADYRVPDPDSQDEFFAAKDEKWWQFGKKKSSSFSTKNEDPFYGTEKGVQ